ncbi:MAG: serine/threonine protein phosphatase [Oscillospiraceae bacterium]|nr:serine/threonine protein phosphatase [Oscillospiraceae bacterium]
MKFTKSKRASAPAAAVTQLRGDRGYPFGSLRSFIPLSQHEYRLYQSMREALPVLDAAIGKLVRLTGGFHAECAQGQAQLAAFLRTVPCGRGQRGIHSFLAAYLDSLLLYGRAIGEMVVTDRRFSALCWGDVTTVQIEEGSSPLDVAICAPDENGAIRPLPYQHLLLLTTLNPEPANPYGVSLLRSMPFLADILMKIYQTVGVNWEHAGNVRYAVVCKPSGDSMERSAAAGHAEAIAEEWAAAMQDSKNGVVRDFVAVGDVSVKVIGSDGQILDSEIPVRQLLEQLVAKTGLPPFLLGLNWSSTERMSRQQADLLTSELWAIRRAVEPALERICELWLRLNGYGCTPHIVWDDICLQDLVEEAHAALYRAQAQQLESSKE